MGILDDLRGFHFDTALSTSPAALPAFARPGHVLFGSDWPFAPTAAGQYFANGPDAGVDPGTLAAVNSADAEPCSPAWATPRCRPPVQSPSVRLRRSARRAGARLFFRLVQSSTR